jgi:hypothetical protein
MKLTYIPLLPIQRELHRIPRSYERFDEYLRTVLNEDRSDVELIPLLAANPMAKEHVTALLDQYLAMDADGIAVGAIAEAAVQLDDEPGDFKASLVLADDLMGGWTNRYDYEYNLRRPGPGQKRFWITGYLWSTEPATERAVREAILTAVYRTDYVLRHGPAHTLRDLLVQEGQVLTMAGCDGPVLDDEDIEYTREVLRPFMDASDKRSLIECLFGDAAGATLGFTPRGLSHWAGVALAVHDARMTDARDRVAVQRRRSVQYD